MRILVVKPVLPFPPNQGTRVVSFELIQALSAMHSVTVLCRLIDGAEVHAAAELNRYCERVVAILAPNRRSVLHRLVYRAVYTLRSLLFGRSMKSQYDCPGELVRAARELSRENFDLVIVEYWQLYRLLDVFDSARTVLLTHDIDMLVNQRAALLEQRLFHKIGAVRRWMLEQREEKAAYKRARNVLALTERDAGVVARLAGETARVEVLPFGVDATRFETDIKRRANEVLFMGAMSAGFNRDAMVFFGTKVWPHLDEGNVQLRVVGGELPAEVAFLAARSNVSVTGRVDDVRECLARAAVLVIPLRYGGGLRIRTLEAMMAGTPVVCTSVAMAGMPFESGKEYLLADDPAAIAASIQRILVDPELGRILSANARRRTRELYGQQAQRTRLLTLIESLTKQ